MSEYDHEPVRGLPAPLPPGEHILWQGSPGWRPMARRAFHVRLVAIYFGVLIAWRVLIALTEAQPLDVAAAGVGRIAAVAVLGTGLLALLGWLSARSTVYTLTNRRVVLRIGIALPQCINLPLTAIETAGLAVFAEGDGDLPLTLKGPSRLSYLQLWPHARAWRIGKPQPMLRAVPDAANVARLLTDALLAAVPDGRRVEAAPAAVETFGGIGAGVPA